MTKTLEQYLSDTDKLFEEKIFKIVARIIGTSLQEGTITGKYADDFEKCRKEILELCHERQIGLVEVVKGLVPKEIKEETIVRGIEHYSPFTRGFNSCREQFLKNLEGEIKLNNN